MATQKLIRAKKPIIEAFQFTDEASFADILIWMNSSGELYAGLNQHTYSDGIMLLKTGPSSSSPLVSGDWVVRDSDNVFRKMTNDLFIQFWEEYL